MTLAPCSCLGRKIPLWMKRNIRRRCGFGCVMCGLPIFEYHHMTPWHKARKHVESDITLLCDNDHRRAGAGLLPEQQVHAANAKPNNVSGGMTGTERLYFSGPAVLVHFATVAISSSNEAAINEQVLLTICGLPIISCKFDNGNLLITATFYDENNRVLLQILDNELTFAVDAWDVQFVKNRLTISDAARVTRLQFEFVPPSQLGIIEARLQYNGIKVAIDSKCITVTGPYGTHSSSPYLNVSDCAFPVLVAIGPVLPHVKAAVHLPIGAEGRSDQRRADSGK